MIISFRIIAQYKIMKISYSQFRVHNIDSFNDFSNHVEKHIKMASKKESKMILFPEFCTAELLTISEIYSGMNSEQMLKYSAVIFEKDLDDMWKGLAEKYQISIAAGTHFCYHKEQDKYYNTAYIYDKNGNRYEQSKTHTSYELVYNKNLTCKSDKLSVFEIDGVKYGIAICYDNSFPEVARILLLQGAEVILSPSCCLDEWGKNRNMLFSRARATENLVYVVNAQLIGGIAFPPNLPYGFNFTGKSGIYSPINVSINSSSGILVQSESNKEEVRTAEIDLDRIRTMRKNVPNNNLLDRRPEFYKKYM